MDANDHDLLVRLNENMVSLREEVKQITTSVGDKITDHETRIRLVEAAADRAEGAAKANRWLITVISVALLGLEVLYYYTHP